MGNETEVRGQVCRRFLLSILDLGGSREHVETKSDELWANKVVM